MRGERAAGAGGAGMSNIQSALSRLRIPGFLERIVAGALKNTFDDHGIEDKQLLERMWISSAVKRICQLLRASLKEKGDL